MARSEALAAILKQRGMVTRIALACGVSPSTVSEWTAVPARHVITVASIADVPAESILPAPPLPRGRRAGTAAEAA